MELVCSMQQYHWGNLGSDSLVAKLAGTNLNISINENEPYAEFWMGTHPSGPALLKVSSKPLAEHLVQNPEQLGSRALQKFGKDLPFLFKVLSVREPLSIQAHPTKAHAEVLHAKFPSVYKDGNHKPEIAIAITEFQVLCGFRPVAEVKNFLKEILEFKILIDKNKYNQFIEMSEDNSEECIKLFKDCFESFMSNPEDKVSLASEKLLERLDGLNESEKEKYLQHLVQKINTYFPNDIGIFCVYWLNYVQLSPGEALYLAPNEPHAYLYGNCIECMSNSDNVVRAGLTPKFRDVKTLCSMLTYKNYTKSGILFAPVIENEFSILYSPPIEDFAVVKIKLPENIKYALKKRNSASILLVFEGSGLFHSTTLDTGKVLFIPAGQDGIIVSYGLILYQAFCNI